MNRIERVTGFFKRERDTERERKGREVRQRRISGLLPCTGLEDIGVRQRAKREKEKKKTGIE